MSERSDLLRHNDNMAAAVVRVSDLSFAWPRGPRVLDIPAFQLGRGEKLFLRGPSGSGKSTLLGVIAGVLTPQKGVVEVCGRNLKQLSGSKRDAFRAEHLGVIFQLFNLLPYLSVAANTALPCRFSKARRLRAEAGGLSVAEEAKRLLRRLGLSGDDVLDKRVRDLSVGQQQRVAAARALIGAPDIIIADEPTSALDADARDLFLRLLIEEAASNGSSLLFVSHDASLSSHFDRSVDLGSINRSVPANDLATA